LGEGGTLPKVFAGDGGAEIIQRLVNDGVITDRERPQYLNQRTGKITPEGRVRLARLMTGRYFQDAMHYDQTPPVTHAKLERMASPLARLEQHPGWDHFGDLVREALQVMNEADTRKLTRSMTISTTSRGCRARPSTPPQRLRGRTC
jgi:hypothetical protein